MSRLAHIPAPLGRRLKLGAAWPAFMAQLQASCPASDNQPQGRAGFQVLDRVTIRREIRFGETHILQGAPGIITTVRNRGRLLDVEFAGQCVTLHHLDVLPAQGAPAEPPGARVVPLPARRPLLARPDNAVHPRHLMRREPQVRVGRV